MISSMKTTSSGLKDLLRFYRIYLLRFNYGRIFSRGIHMSSVAHRSFCQKATEDHINTVTEVAFTVENKMSEVIFIKLTTADHSPEKQFYYIKGIHPLAIPK